MNIFKTLIAVGAALASLGANAALNASTTPLSGSFLALASTGAHTGTLGGSFATIVGGAILTSDSPTADMQAFGGAPFGGNFLAAGPTSTAPAIVTLAAPTTFVSFLWGSPDTYNTLTVTTNVTSYNFIPGGVGGLSFLDVNGSQQYAQYVGFSATGGEMITGLRLASPSDAFEAANFSVTAVPEPETYALMLAGLGVVGFIARRRKSN